MPKSDYLDPQLTSLLDSLRHRVRRYIVWDSLLAISAVVLAAFWGGLALDFLPVQLGGTEMPRSARLVLLVAVGVLLVGIVVRLLIARLARPLPDDSLALLVERHHPSLGGRLVTAVQLSRPGRRGDSHSPQLLQRVHRQAAEAIDRVDPSRLFRREPLARKAMIVAPLLIAAVGLAIFSPQTFGRAAGRLTLLNNSPWPRETRLEMVGIELPVVTATEDETLPPELVTFDGKSVRLPRGSSGTLRIRAAAGPGDVVPDICTVHYRTDAGTEGQSNMRRIGRVNDGYQSFVLDGPPLMGLGESLTLSIYGNDDRLEEFRIQAVEPPAITELKVAVRYPDYLRLPGAGPVDMETGYEAGLRLREGSDVSLIATSSRPLGEVDFDLRADGGQPQPVSAEYSDDRRQVRFKLKDFDTATTVRMVPRDREGISAQAPYRYFFAVVMDQPPELNLRLRGIGSAVTPIARLPIQADAADDYGIDELEVSVVSAAETGSADGPSNTDNSSSSTDSDSTADKAPDEAPEAAAAATVAPPIDRQGRAEAELDLRDLVDAGRLPSLEPGGAVNVFGEVSDHYDLHGKHVTRSEIFRLEIVTPEDLLARLERRELAMRARLEQTIDETRNLRDSLDLLRRRSFQPEEGASEDESEEQRSVQVRRLRVQQNGLQADKTQEELLGIAASLDDLLLEMVNNRVDSVDRRERIATGVRDPLKEIAEGPLSRLIEQIGDVEVVVDRPAQAAERTGRAVETAEEVLLELEAVLERMLELESYNEILDIVRDLIDDQEDLLDETKQEQKQRVLDLFE